MQMEYDLGPGREARRQDQGGEDNCGVEGVGDRAMTEKQRLKALLQIQKQRQQLERAKVQAKKLADTFPSRALF